MDRVRFIEHNGTRIVLLDFSGITDVELGLVEVAKAKRFIGTQPPNGTTLTLTDVRETKYDRKIIEAFKDMTAANKPIVKAAAVVSNAALHQAAIAMIAFFSRRKLQVFDNREAALDWLAAQA